DGRGDLAVEVLPQLLASDRAHLGGLLTRVPDHQLVQVPGEQLDEAVVDRALDDQPLGGDAGLPALMIRDRAETSAAFSRSASASTMEGSEPPSSSTAGLISLAAIEATREPARSEPVKDTAWIRGSRMTRSTSSVAACRVWKT